MSTPATSPTASSAAAQAASPAASPAAQAAKPVAIEMMDVKFNTTEISIPAGTDITFTNKGVLPHDFTVDSPAPHSGTLAAGYTATLKVNVPAGAYTYYCSRIDTRRAGMVGTPTAR